MRRFGSPRSRDAGRRASARRRRRAAPRRVRGGSGGSAVGPSRRDPRGTGSVGSARPRGGPASGMRVRGGRGPAGVGRPATRGGTASRRVNGPPPSWGTARRARGRTGRASRGTPTPSAARRVRDGLVAATAVRRGVAGDVDRVGAELAGERAGRRPRAGPARAGAPPRSRERRGAGHSALAHEPDPVRGGPSAARGALIEHEQRDDLVGLCERGGERRMIVDAEVAAEPDDRVLGMRLPSGTAVIGRVGHIRACLRRSSSTCRTRHSSCWSGRPGPASPRSPRAASNRARSCPRMRSARRSPATRRTRRSRRRPSRPPPGASSRGSRKRGSP